MHNLQFIIEKRESSKSIRVFVLSQTEKSQNFILDQIV
jgi:hypothetical protein